MKPHTRASEKRKDTFVGYKRWKKQLQALNSGDLEMVKRLADEARRVLENKRRSLMSLPFYYEH